MHNCTKEIVETIPQIQLIQIPKYIFSRNQTKKKQLENFFWATTASLSLIFLNIKTIFFK